MKIAVACGGTGGHTIPGLAVARTLKSRGHEVSLWLSGRDVEGGATVDWDGKIVSVYARGLSTDISATMLVSACSLITAPFRCRRRMIIDRPDGLVAMGSYSSVGPVIAARWLGVPVVLHEANAVPGRAISLLSRFASVVAVSFAETAQYLPRRRVVLTGMPIRADLSDTFSNDEWPRGDFTVLVMGGSQGAHRINECGVAAVCALHRKGRRVRVIHLSGSKDEAMVRDAYAGSGVRHKVFGFLKEMGKAYNAADIVIARAGAASCAELAHRAVPALLVPFPAARRDHQLANAKALARSGGVDVIEQKDLTVERLEKYIDNLMSQSARLAEMRDNLAKLPKSRAADAIADLAEQEAERAKGRELEHADI